MKKTITLKIENKSFDISLDSDFADLLSKDLHQNFEDVNDIQIKDLLRAYVKKNYELFEFNKNFGDKFDGFIDQN